MRNPAIDPKRHRRKQSARNALRAKKSDCAGRVRPVDNNRLQGAGDSRLECDLETRVDLDKVGKGAVHSCSTREHLATRSALQDPERTGKTLSSRIGTVVLSTCRLRSVFGVDETTL